MLVVNRELFIQTVALREFYHFHSAPDKFGFSLPSCYNIYTRLVGII